jgi:glycosyltransferase involved in cell wall biosynthesis
MNLAAKLELSGVVQWLGWLPQTELTNHYIAADVLIFPSLRDSGGMVVLEALAHGLPVLCTDLGGPGLIVNATCGRAVETRDRSPEQVAAALAEALLEVLESPGVLESLSRGAKLRARDFAFENLVRSVYPAPLPRAWVAGA